MKADESNNQQAVKTDDYGRADDGRFAPGNKFASGNPFAARVAKFRSALFDAVDVDDLKAIFKKLIEMAKAGDVAAAKIVIERLLGQADALDLICRIEALEEAAGKTGMKRRLAS